jgi:hypothetical protein
MVKQVLELEGLGQVTVGPGGDAGCRVYIPAAGYDNHRLVYPARAQQT